jgi:hypothetical protein
MSDYAQGAKKVPFDGTEENFYLWKTQLIGFAETYRCDQALLPIQYSTLDPNDPLDKILRAARKANSTAMCVLSNSLIDNISQSALYNYKTTKLPGGFAQKAWENLQFFKFSTLSMSTR